jgi:predicted ATPase/signal transduction histidine kinase
MFSLPGYRITEELHAGAKTQIYRGYRDQDQCPVILKTLNDDYPTQKDLACLQHEYALTKDWNENSQLDGLLRSYALLKHQHTQVLVQQDIGGVSLNRLLADQALPLETFLTLAIAFTRSLSRLHQCHLIHKDINPSNLVVNIKTNQVQIIDFGIATQLSRETTQMQNPGHLEGTLAYLSPEQTGRMNRALDYRTDFYSLGATFYEMLACVPPFTATDPMELVHCHLARTPPPLNERRPEVPQVLCDLVQKLMAKTAEARYQSAFGLIADLETCQRLFNFNANNNDNDNDNDTASSIPAFPLGQKDISERFQVPQKLYGRETEIGQVLNAFERVSQGHTEILLVAGYSGVGKTDLVHELHKSITKENGYCIDGKFDQFQRDIPYASLIQAFQELLRQLLTESPAQIAHWKTVLNEALGGIAQVIIEVIPEVALILGPQPPVPELPPAQAQNRFNLVFQQFIRTFTTKEHPLVLFLDDLQWADLPSLQLIKLFMTDPETRYLLVIGAYRDNEVQPTHSLMLTLDEIRQTTTRMETITLRPLNQEHIQQLVAETFYCDERKSASLAQLCLQKTQGNPFFLSQFLRALVETQHISFNHTTGHWQWDIAQLQHTQITNNVVELMAEKIQTLPKTTQAVIQLAACIGNQFDLTTLALACEQSFLATAQSLWPALQEHLIVPLDETYKYIGDIGIRHQASENPAEKQKSEKSEPSPNPTFKFVHDRVQQAAYSLIQEDSKGVFHLRIGRRLLAHLSLAERDERIFDLVYQWNKGHVLLTDEIEKEQLARLNLIAGGKAKSSAAYHPALSYFQTGLQLVAESGWRKHYELTLSLYVEATEAAYLCGDFAQMDDLAKNVLQRAGNLLDRVKVYQIQIQACIFQDRSLDAIKIGLPVLRQLGVKLPKNPTTLHILRGVLETKLALLGKPIEALSKLPPMTEAEPLAAMQVLSSIVSAAYLAAPQLVALITCKQVSLSVKHGNTALSAYGYAGYGLILCGAMGDIETGYRFGTLSVATLEHFSAKALKARIINLVENFIKHWKDPLHERLAPLLEGYQNGVETGDFEYAAYMVFNYTHFLYIIGRELSRVQKELEKYAQMIAQFKQEQTAHLQKILLQTVANLQGQCNDPCRLKGRYYDEDTIAFTAGNRLAMFLFHCNKMLLSFLFQKHPQALEHALAAEQNLDGGLAFPNVSACHFHMALVRLALYPDAPKNEQKLILKKVASIQKNLKKWAGHAPLNNLHKWHLVEAERKRVSGDDFTAMKHYDQAITLAIKNDFPQEAALANELAARFHLSKGRTKLAKMYLQDAHYGYQQWGAAAKVKHLEEQYPEWFSRVEKRSATETLPTTLSMFSAGTSTSGTTSGILDLATVMKASQSISGEIILERLLEKLMRMAIENAGAQKGFLLLKKDGEWRIEAAGNVNAARITVLQSLPLSPDFSEQKEEKENPARPDLSVALIQYVDLTKEALVLDNAFEEGRFVNDPYIRRKQAKSILCAPIMLQGKLAGMLYLENNLIEGAFTADRLELLKILSGQAAISIENARVYENLESTVAQRTAALSESNAALLESHAALSNAYTVAESAREHAENAEYKATAALNDLREAQTQLVQSAKMASLGHLVAGVAHELNTPIGNALTTASVLADSSSALKMAMLKGEIRKSSINDFVDDAVQMTEVISRSCQRAATLITSFKQVAADQTSEQRRTFNLHSLVADNIAALGAGFKGARWVCKTEIPDDIECDSYPGPLGQVIANLVQNAGIHAFDGRISGTLTITATVKPGDEVEANEVEMLFSDDGNGMEPAILAHIFEPFYTARSGRDQDRKQGGPGLGLSISLNIVTGVLGGTLSASSEPGCGSQFYLTFPINAPQTNRAGTDTGFISPPA